MKITKRKDGSTYVHVEIRYDGNGSPYIEWEQVEGIYKRAWIQVKTDQSKDWANTKRYLNVVRCNSAGHPGGNPTDFPIFNNLPDEQILISFVQNVNALTGLHMPIVHEKKDRGAEA